MPTDAISIDKIWKRAAIFVLLGVVVLYAAFTMIWAFANTIALKSNEKEVALLAESLAPGDPQTHYAAAVLLEKTFDPADIERSLSEFEKAAALSPHNFLYWSALGKARERNGDREGAEAALRRAAELAPNYARVRWALGNVLLRQGKIEEGFAEIRRAADADKSFSVPAASVALQLFDGEPTAVINALDDSVSTSSALVTLLSGQKRFDEAVSVWNGIPQDTKATELPETGRKLAQQLTEGKRFRLGASILRELGDDSATGTIANGGFENGVKMQNAGAFEWQIAGGAYPQIALTDGQKNEGGYSLVVVFGTPQNSEFRSISQTVPVEPGMTYTLNFFYKAELKTNAAFRWEVVSASDGKRLAATEKLDAAIDWSRQNVRFAAPADADGVTVRLIREDCRLPLCTVSGRIWFDSFQLVSNL